MKCLLYIDPGSGSIIVQAIIGLAAGAAFFIRLNWYRLKSWFSGGKKENEDSESENS
ncbi:MAG: hypothetical protein K1X92_04675 [Bacteroidia bacterium]|nr:hypothetical protein [Bacteroidia bacterium]